MLVETIRMGNKEEYFTGIFEGNKDRVYRICCSFVRSHHNRKDLFQEIFMNIWKSLNSFQNKSHINTWIYRISINTAINFCKLQDKNENRCQEIKHEIFEAAGNEIKKKQETDRQLKVLLGLINSLPLLEKTIITLVLEGMDRASIAEICGLSEGNVRVKIHRIKSKLKKMMEGENHEL